MSERTCAVEGCLANYHCKGYCANHYTAWKRHGDPLKRVRRLQGSAPPLCSIQGCGRPVDSRGWCDRHYRIWKRNGDPLVTKAPYQPCRTPEAFERRLSGLAIGRAMPRERMPEEERLRRNRANGRASQARIRAANPEETRRKRRQQMANYGPGYRQKWNHYNRLRRKGIAPPTPEAGEYALILRGDPCCYCGAPMEHVDHIEPIALGGIGDWDNLTAACALCNLQKNTKPLLTFLLERRTA